MKIKFYFLKYWLAAIFLITICYTQGQTVSAPYSILGLGDISHHNNGRYTSIGNASTSLRGHSSINLDNPASLTALDEKFFHADISFHGRMSKFLFPQKDTFTSTAKDISVARIALAFKINPRYAISIAFKPFSSVNYSLAVHEKLDNTSNYDKNIEGSGGINQVSFALARSTGKKFSIGVNASYLFGSMQRQTDYLSEDLFLGITKKEDESLSGFGLQTGVQYYNLKSSGVGHQAGLSFTFYSKLSRNLNTTYTENNQVIKDETGKQTSFSLPLTIAGGYSIQLNKELLIATDFRYYDWNIQHTDLANTYTKPSYRGAGGIEYSNKMRAGGYREKYFLNAGFYLEEYYLMINSGRLYDYAFTAGAGIHSRFISLYGGFGLGVRGNNKWGQIKEKYTQFHIGITIKEIWMNFSKYDR